MIVLANVKHELVALLVAKLKGTALLKSDGKTHATYTVLTAKPPWILLKDFLLTQKYDLLFTVKRNSESGYRFSQNVPINYKGTYEIGVWTIDKQSVDGDGLRDQAVEEALRIIEDNPFPTTKTRICILPTREDDHALSNTQIYNSIIPVSHIKNRITD